MSVIGNFVSYVKQTWLNKPNMSTPVSAERLTHMESGIKANSDAVKAIADAVTDEIEDDPDKIPNMRAFTRLRYEVNGFKRKLLPLTGEVKALRRRLDGLGNPKPCSINSVDSTAIRITFAKQHAERNVAIVCKSGSARLYEVYKLQGWDVSANSLHSTGTSATKELINVIVDGETYTSIGALTAGLAFLELVINSKTTINGVVYYSTVVVSENGVKIIESTADGANLIKTFIRSATSSVYATVMDHGTYAHWFRINADTTWVEYVEDLGNTVVKTLSVGEVV